MENKEINNRIENAIKGGVEWEVDYWETVRDNRTTDNTQNEVLVKQKNTKDNEGVRILPAGIIKVSAL